MATGARRNGTPTNATAKTRPPRRNLAAAAEPKPPSDAERITALEERVAALDGQLRAYMAQQLLKDPRVQEMLQRELAARLGNLPQPPP